MKNLKTKIQFDFEEQDDLPVFNVDMKIKSPKKMKKEIKIEQYKKIKRKNIDASTELF